MTDQKASHLLAAQLDWATQLGKVGGNEAAADAARRMIQWQEVRWANMYRGGNLGWWRENRSWSATVLLNEGCPLHWAVLILAGRPTQKYEIYQHDETIAF